VGAQDSLPGDGFAPGWKKNGPVRTFVRQDLFNHIDGGAELYLEFGFEKCQVQSYTDGKSELVLEVYEMSSPLSALGIYLFQAGRESPWPEIRARNSSEEAQAAAWKGRFFIRINNFDGVPGTRPVMTALAGAFLASVAAENPPDPFGILPAEGRKAGSERLIRGPIALQPYFTFGEGDMFGLDGKLFGVLADYGAADGSNYHRLIVEYTEAKGASAAFSHLTANLDPYLKITETSGTEFGFVDFQGRFGRVVLRGRTLDVRFKMKVRG